MQIKEYHRRIDGKTLLYVRQCMPDAKPDGIVMMLHGTGEHCGCYAQWANRFTGHSTGCILFDWRGHGRSSGKRGHAALSGLKSDLHAMIRTAREEYPQTRIFLYGHSMGGLIALACAMDERPEITGVIASSPWMELLHPPPPLLARTAAIASLLFPSWTVRTGIKAEQLAMNGSQKSSKTDALIHKRISVKLFTDLRQAAGEVLQNRYQPHLPVLLMFGKEDRLVSRRAGELLAGRIASVEYKLWDGMGHDLPHEVHNDAVFYYVLNWMIRQIRKDGNV
ncbi:MAG: lysophospholipase [Bacteroidales bacterium]|jgi:alpha-beta hydrolase superfamily lysophospholipase|nr:lysophospholipase [Bacteroidales bacterium]